MNVYANNRSCTVANTVPIKFAYYARSLVQGQVISVLHRQYRSTSAPFIDLQPKFSYPSS